jgi:hypothetical protein
MDELTARIEALFLQYWAVTESRGDEPRCERDRRPVPQRMKLLIAEYGKLAVDAALHHIPNEPPPSVSGH